MLPASWYNDDDDDLVSFLQNKDVLRRGYNKGVSQKHVFDDFFLASPALQVFGGCFDRLE